MDLPAIRTFRTGDMGAIASAQAILYAEAYGWGRPLEVMLGEVTTAFLRDFREGHEQCWVAEVGGRLAGAIFCVRGEAADEARLRLLHVDAAARGHGIGGRLVAECVAFARGAGYRSIGLWTHTILESARRLYAAAGFVLVATEEHREFGEPVHGEQWRLDLA